MDSVVDEETEGDSKRTALRIAVWVLEQQPDTTVYPMPAGSPNRQLGVWNDWVEPDSPGSVRGGFLWG